jgi:hypothetical protein
MSPKQRHIDERQITLDFERSVDECISTMSEIAVQTAEIQTDTAPEDLIIDVDELYTELALECKRAIREAGMNVEQIAAAINMVFSFGPGETTVHPVSVAVMRNYLGKPTTNRLPIWVVLGICSVTNNHGPIDALIRRLGLTVIDSREQLSLTLGVLEGKFREIGAAKRKVEKQIRLIKGRTDINRIASE